MRCKGLTSCRQALLMGGGERWYTNQTEPSLLARSHIGRGEGKTRCAHSHWLIGQTAERPGNHVDRPRSEFNIILSYPQIH